MNLSYWVLEAFPTLARLDPATDWPGVEATGLALIGAAAFGPRLLPPEWLSLKATPAPAEGFAPEFGYNALRIPLYLLRGASGPRPARPLPVRHGRGRRPRHRPADRRRALDGARRPRLPRPRRAGRLRPRGDPLPRRAAGFRADQLLPSTLHLLALAHAREAMPQCV